jgi:phenylacetate-CoA ligase
MGKFITKYIAFPLQEYINKTRIFTTRDFLLHSQTWKLEQLESYQLDKLKRLIEHAYKNIPYYQNVFDEKHLKPSDIRSFDDLNKIPVLTKDIARRESKNLIDPNYNKYHFRRGATGGTSGVPLPVLWDSNDISFTWGGYYRWFNWMGAEHYDKVAILWGARTVIKNKGIEELKSIFKDRYYNRLTINTFELNNSNIEKTLQQIEQFNPVILRGYLSSLIYVANYIKQNNIKINLNIKAISPTTETLLPPYRELLEQVFNAKVFDQFGCGETNSIAFECEQHSGMHLNMEHVYLENYNKPGVQKVIFTNLDNFIMPFIRYENGDSVEFTNTECSCGRKHHLIKQIIGRSADNILLKNGSKVHGVFFTDILREVFGDFTLNINRFQVYQSKDESVEFRIEPLPKFSENDKIKLESALEQFLKSVKITEMEKIPSDASGKFRYVVSEV